MQPIGFFLRKAFAREELLMERMFQSLKDELSKTELRSLLKKLKVPEAAIMDLEQRLPARDQLPERVLQGLRFWRQHFGPTASINELIRITHIINFEALSIKLNAMKVYSQ